MKRSCHGDRAMNAVGQIKAVGHGSLVAVTVKAGLIDPDTGGGSRTRPEHPQLSQFSC